MHKTKQYFHHWSRLLHTLALVSCLCAGLSNPAVADGMLTATPLDTANRLPLANAQGIPQAAPAQLVAAGSLQWQVSSEIANISVQNLQPSQLEDYLDGSNTEGELLIFDGELYRLELAARYGINARSDFLVRLPYIVHTSGFLDSGIEQWHQWFGLPNGNRGVRPTDALLYQYQVDGETKLFVDQDQHGFGDLQLEYRYGLNPGESATHAALRAGIKLPTGSANKLSGSDAYQLSLGLEFGQPANSASTNLGWHASFGGLWNEDDGLLAEYKKEWAFYSSVGARWQFNPRLALAAQIDSHSTFYRSDAKELGDASSQLAIGLNMQLQNGQMLQVYFTEDIAVDTAPDIMVGFTLRLNSLIAE